MRLEWFLAGCALGGAIAAILSYATLALMPFAP